MPLMEYTVVNTSIVGAIGGLSAFITYRKNQTLKRQEILFPLINEFDTNKNIFYAKELIDYIPVQIEDDKGNILGKYEKKLQRLLNEGSQQNKDVINIKIVFDSLLNFLRKLGYLIDTHILTRHDVTYFEYYIEKVRNDPSIIQYSVDQRYDLFLVLLDRTGYVEEGIEDKMCSIIAEYNKRAKRKFFFVC
jgi:hypothetical protein